MVDRFYDVAPSPECDVSAVRGVVFDVFGTLCQHGQRRSPYRQLLSRRKSEGSFWLREVLCNPYSLAQVADALKLNLVTGELDLLEQDLQDELVSVSLYPDVIYVLKSLIGAGFKLGVVSNLAMPYAEPAWRLLSGLMDVKVWSFEKGYMKPDPEIYSCVAEELGIPPQQILFIGDSPICDVQGPRKAGFKARLLDRDQRHSDANSLTSLREVLGLLQVN